MKLIDKLPLLPKGWHELTNDQFVILASALMQYAQGKIGPMCVKIALLIKCLGYDSAANDERVMSGLTILGNQYFHWIFRIVYPDGALDGIPADALKELRNIPPHQCGSVYARAIRKYEYTFQVDAVFCKQFVPELKVGSRTLKGYAISCDFDRVACDLPAIRFAEARELLGRIRNERDYALLAAILYAPASYSSAEVADLATEIEKTVDKEIIYAITLNFSAFTTYLFTRTGFDILLNTDKSRDKKDITLGLSESVYSLSEDGYGSISDVESMDCIKYLTILRKKLIEAIRMMKDNEMDIAAISDKTKLPVTLINRIV